MKNYTKNIIQDSIYWDIVNWSKAIEFWDNFLKHIPNNARAIELGCGANGGLSLWLASKGYDVVCSGYNEISETTKNIHNKYNLAKKIEYRIVDALAIPYKEYFDVVCFKSILGGIVRDNDQQIAEKVISEIYKALKPGGALLFSENLTASKFHRLLRTKYGALKNKWRYFTIAEMEYLLKNYSSFNYKTFGFIGCFGRNEKQKQLLGQIDSFVFDKILSDKLHYLISGIVIK
jgi:SAM-dependent methyltransferase